MAGRKVENNHKVVESPEEKTPAEELIAQQGDVSEEYEFGEDEKDSEAELPATGDKTGTPGDEAEPDEEPKAEVKAVAHERKVILVGAASYYGCGQRFLKNTETPVSEDTYRLLLSTGLFVGV